MSIRGFTTEQIVLDAKAGTGIGTPVMVDDFKTMTLSFGTAATSTLTVKFQGSISDTMPDFAAAQSVSNHWDYIDVIDLQDGSSIDGDTGIAVAGGTDFRLFEVNGGGLKWLCAVVTARTGGSATVKVKCFEN